MKKLLAILLSAVMLLSLVACGEDVPPADDDQNNPPVTAEEPEKTPIAFETGSIDMASGEDVYDLVRYESIDECPNYKDNMSEVFVDFVSDRESCEANISPRMMEAYKNNEYLNPILGNRQKCFLEYDDTFFEQNQLVTFTVWSFKWLTLDAKLWSYEDENDNIQYYVELIVKNFDETEGNEALVRSNVTLELDKDIDINSENLTVKVIDNRKYK